MPTVNKTIKKPLRLLAIIALAAWLTTVGSAAEPLAHAAGERIALFGTVITTPVDGIFEVATRDGVITLTISDSTKIDDKRRNKLSLDEVVPGNSVTGYYTVIDSNLIAGKLTFVKTGKGSKSVDFRHVIGVVIDTSGDNLTILTPDGEQVDITAPSDPTSDPATQGSLVVTVVEENLTTGELDAIALRTAEETVARLADAISYEISLAQQQLLKIRMSETASVHLTRLYETLDKIEVEAQAKVEAAFTVYQETYTTTLDENLIAPPLVQISGKVLAIGGSTMTIAAKGNGRRSYLTVPYDARVKFINGESGRISDVNEGQFVDVTATDLPPSNVSI
jgi:hypothetical protein